MTQLEQQLDAYLDQIRQGQSQSVARSLSKLTVDQLEDAREDSAFAEREKNAIALYRDRALEALYVEAASGDLSAIDKYRHLTRRPDPEAMAIAAELRSVAKNLLNGS